MTTPTTQREADERCACGTHTKRACDLAGVCGQNTPAPRAADQSPDDRARFMAYCDYAIDGADTIDRDWLFRFCTDWQARAAIDQSTRQAAPEVPTHDLLNVLEMARQSLRLGRNEKARGHVGHAIFLLTRAPTAATDQPSAGQVDDESDDAYDHACELMEAGWRERAKRGVEIGTEGSLCDGICWLFDRIRHLEAHASLTPTAPQAASQQAESEASDAMLEFKTWDELLAPQAATPASASDVLIKRAERIAVNLVQRGLTGDAHDINSLIALARRAPAFSREAP